MATYDLEPKMAAEPVADAMVREIEAGNHALLICNLAPPDMVGHTGFMDKATPAHQTKDCAVVPAYRCSLPSLTVAALVRGGACTTVPPHGLCFGPWR